MSAKRSTNENNISLLYITYFLFLFIPPHSTEGEWWLLKYLPGVNATRNILLTNTSHTVYRFLYPAHAKQSLPHRLTAHKNFLILC